MIVPLAEASCSSDVCWPPPGIAPIKRSTYSMGDTKDKRDPSSAARREFLKRSAMAMAAPAIAPNTVVASQDEVGQGKPRKKPNLIIYIADQFPWGLAGAKGQRNERGAEPRRDGRAGRLHAEGRNEPAALFAIAG